MCERDSPLLTGGAGERLRMTANGDPSLQMHLQLLQGATRLCLILF